MPSSLQHCLTDFQRGSPNDRSNADSPAEGVSIPDASYTSVVDFAVEMAQTDASERWLSGRLRRRSRCDGRLRRKQGFTGPDNGRHAIQSRRRAPEWTRSRVRR